LGRIEESLEARQVVSVMINIGDWKMVISQYDLQGHERWVRDQVEAVGDREGRVRFARVGHHFGPYRSKL
jgi:hypothetical protein